MSGVLFFSKSPYRPPPPSQTVIELPEEDRTLNGGAPSTDYSGMIAIDCGGPDRPSSVYTIDGDAP